MSEFFKFPSTPHIVLPEEAELRKEKVMPAKEIEELLQHELIVEEKVDGANLGISFDSEGNLCLQNRGSCLQEPLIGQWKQLKAWIEKKQSELFDLLLDKYILFGEWCYAVHSIYYNELPDYFIGFDLYDKKEGKFLSTDRRNKMLKYMDISIICQYSKGFFQLKDLYSLFSKSNYGDMVCEGLYIRWDENGWLKKRAKLVRYDFRQEIGEHWSRKELKRNKLYFCR